MIAGTSICAAAKAGATGETSGAATPKPMPATVAMTNTPIVTACRKRVSSPWTNFEVFGVVWCVVRIRCGRALRCSWQPLGPVSLLGQPGQSRFGATSRCLSGKSTSVGGQVCSPSSGMGGPRLSFLRGGSFARGNVVVAAVRPVLDTELCTCLVVNAAPVMIGLKSHSITRHDSWSDRSVTGAISWLPNGHEVLLRSPE